MDQPTLVVLSPLRGFLLPNGKILLTQKFVDGMKLYRDLWGPSILHLCEPAKKPSHNLDNIEVGLEGPDFRTICAPFSAAMLKSIIPTGSVVLSSVGEEFNIVANACKEIGAKCVYVSEYSLATRLQIIDSLRVGIVASSWKKLRQAQQEQRQRRSIGVSDGLQCNGVPTYSLYKGLCPNSLLFFDSRVTADMIISDFDLNDRLCRSSDRGKLHLIFSGRLDAMKGVSDLPLIADELRRLGIQFEMSICGDGVLARELREAIRVMGLDDVVYIEGNLDFKSQLIPYVSRWADLFVCSHPQGDPSCTYLETMSCGVPIVGYGNEALKTVLEISDGGWATEMGNARNIALKIAEIAHNPSELKLKSVNAQQFAKNHTFEKTFKRRVDHLKTIAS